MSKILLTGSSGVLGSSVLRQVALRPDLSVRSLSHQAIRDATADDLRQITGDCDLLIHCAANTNVDACEQTPDVCWADNVLLTEKLVENSKIYTIFISSTGVYGNYLTRSYTEDEVPHPTTMHHKSKLAAEAIVMRSSSKI